MSVHWDEEEANREYKRDVIDHRNDEKKKMKFSYDSPPFRMPKVRFVDELSLEQRRFLYDDGQLTPREYMDDLQAQLQEGKVFKPKYYRDWVNLRDKLIDERNRKIVDLRREKKHNEAWIRSKWNPIYKTYQHMYVDGQGDEIDHETYMKRSAREEQIRKEIEELEETM